MILADTSVWIRHFAGREPYWSALGRLLGAGQIVGHELVCGELLIGVSPGRSREKLVTALKLQPWLAVVAHEQVEAMVGARGLAGRGLSWIDAHLLAAALVSKCQLWTADEVLATVAESVGVRWMP